MVFVAGYFLYSTLWLAFSPQEVRRQYFNLTVHCNTNAQAERDAAEVKRKQREAERKEQRQREALGDAGSNVDPDFLTALIKGGLGFQVKPPFEPASI